MSFTEKSQIFYCFFFFFRCCCLALSHAQLFATPWTVAHQAPLSMGFPRRKYCSGLPFPSPGDNPNPGMKAVSPVLASTGKPSSTTNHIYFFQSTMSMFLPFQNLHLFIMFPLLIPTLHSRPPLSSHLFSPLLIYPSCLSLPFP